MNELIIQLGIILCVILIGIGFYNYFKNMRALAKAESNETFSVRRKNLSLSEINSSFTEIEEGSNSFAEPAFKTLRVYLEKLSETKWRFRIRFVFKNVTRDVITLDDIHTSVYVKYVPTPAYATISYRGEILLLQDNSILKEGQEYSLKPGEGYEMVLVFEQTRLEGAPLYGGDHETAGAMISIYGLFVDYYYFKGADIIRKAIPSDTIYYFQCSDENDPGELHAVDDDFVQDLKSRTFQSESAKSIVDSVDAILKKHVEVRPIVKA